MERLPTEMVRARLRLDLGHTRAGRQSVEAGYCADEQVSAAN